MRRLVLLGVVALFAAVGAPAAWSAPVPGTNVLYTLDAQFDQGTAVNVNHNAPNNNQLQLNATTSTFPFIWVALSVRCTIAKIDTATGTILGEFRTVADDVGCAQSSRTTVGLDGSVWVGHRGRGGATHVGLVEQNQCIDRNANGTIETSSGYGDVEPWPGSVSTVATAADECILHHVDTDAPPLSFSDTRHMSIDAANKLWIGDFSGHDFVRVNGDTGVVETAPRSFACGGYGGLIDGNGVIWSANGGSTGLLRWDPNAPDSDTNPRCIPIPVYGLAIDPNGWVWAGEFGSQVRKVSPDGNTILGPFFNGSSTGAQGLAVTSNGDVWISSSLSCSSSCTVGHLKNDGTFVGNVANPTGAGSTGVAVDATGKVWTANINSHTATRIDPTAGAVGADGATPIGAVDLTVNFPAGPDGRPLPSPYNYSDMTGAVALGATAPQGTWTVVQDGAAAGTAWGTIVWNTEAQGSTPAGTQILVEARAANSEAGLGGLPFVNVSNGAPFTLTGRFLQVRVTLRPSDAGTSPVLSDIRLCAAGVLCAAAPPAATAAPGSCRVTARPRAVPAGEASLFRIRVTRGQQAVANRRVAFRGPGIATSRKTNASGRLSIRLTPSRRGIVRVSVPGLGRGCRARVSVFGTVGGAQLTGRE
jgi:hypothetical protein